MKPQILHDKQLRASKKEQQDTGKFLQLGKSRHFKRENSLTKCGKKSKAKAQPAHSKTEASPARSVEDKRKSSREKQSQEGDRGTNCQIPLCLKC